MRRSRRFLLLGIAAGLVAPAGLFAYSLFVGAAPNPLMIFAAMATGGTLTLGAAGWLIGRQEDRLADRNQHLNRVSRELRALSVTDALTGIPNRRSFDLQLAQEMARADRYDIPVSLVMIDIDHFKRLNDRCGHRVGDDMLRIVAHSLDSGKRTGDLVARFGGEEFVALLPHTSAEQAKIWAERARTAVANEVLDVGNGEQARVTISLGVAQLIPPISTPEALIEAADGALYEAKRQGRDRVVLHNPEAESGNKPLALA